MPGIQNVTIEEVGDITTVYNYLEVFYRDNINPIMDISISEDKQLVFKIYSSIADIVFSAQEWEYILKVASDFLPKAIKNKEDLDKYKFD